MNKIFKENLIFLLFFVFFIVGSLSAVSYLKSDSIFDVSVSYVNDVKFPYSVILIFDKKVNSKLDFDIELIYEKKNLVVGSKTISCDSKICEVKVPINSIFLDKHTVLIRTKYNGKFYEKKLSFNLKNKQKDFDFIFSSNYYFDSLTSANISGIIKTFTGKSEKFYVEVYPKGLPDNKESFDLVCNGECSFDFELKNNIIFGKYLVKIYSGTNAIEKSFNIFLDSKLINSNGFSNPNLITTNLNSPVKKTDKFIEEYDSQREKNIITLTNYSSIEPVEVEYEDILGNKFKKNLSFFSGNLPIDLGIRNIIFSSNSTRLNNLKLDLTPRIDSYSDLEDLKINLNKKKSLILLSGKSVVSEEFDFGGKKYSSVKDFQNSQNISKHEIVPGFGMVSRVLSDGSISTVYFAYGLISINTKKPLYRLNESVDLYMVVLDKNGYLYQGANVSLDVFNSGIKYSYTSKDIKETIKSGLYHLNITANSLGRYDLSSKVMVDGIELSVSSFFNVVSDYPYDIIRRVPFTIDPWQGPFENEFTITAHKNVVKVYDFYEELPKNFKIFDTNGAQIIQTNNSQILKWSGVNTNFKPWYRANSPLKSPDLYKLGKSWIEYRQAGKINKFYENRSWIFAIDPATTFEKGVYTKQKKTFYLWGSGAINDPALFGGGTACAGPISGIGTGLIDPIDNSGLGIMNSSPFALQGFDCFDSLGKVGFPDPDHVSYNLTFNYSKDFKIEGDIQAFLYMWPQQKVGGRDDIQVDLYDSIGNIIATTTRLSVPGGVGPAEEFFTLTPANNPYTLTAGTSLTLKITSTRKDALQVNYGGIYPSRLEIYTKTHVSVDTIDLMNATNHSVIYKTGDILRVFANVSDALQMSDVNSTNITILYPNGSIRTNDLNMSLNITNSSWNYYNYTTNVLAIDPVGTYTVEITAHEGIVTHTSRAYFTKLRSAGNGVSIVPSRNVISNQGSSIDIIHYVFNLDPTNAHSYSLFTNSSFQVTLLEDNGITTLKDNDGDEVIDTGIIQVGQFKKIIARVAVPTDAFINSKNLVQITAKPAAVNYYGTENFESQVLETDPNNWFDTRKNFSLVQDETLFKVKSLGLNKAIGTLSTQDDIHSSYNGTNALNMKDYEITGRFYYSDSNSSLGITFLSDYPNSNKYYSLRADKTNTSIYGDGTANQFHIFSNNGGTLVGDFNSNQNAINKSWYKFRIRLNDTGTLTNIKAKIWKETASEYPFWQIDTNATGASRLTKGTVGFWTKGIGEKYLDDVRISNITIDNTVTDDVKDYVLVQSVVKAQKQLYPHSTAVMPPITSLNSSFGGIPVTICLAAKKIGDCTKNNNKPAIPIPVPPIQLLGSLSFNKSPGFYEDFYLNGSITIPILMLPEPGKAGKKDTVSVKLYVGNTLIGSDTHVDIGNGAGITPFIETFNINPIVDYIPANQNLSLKISSDRKYTYFYLDNSSLMSKINFQTLTYIAVGDIQSYNISGIKKDIFDVNESMVFKINVTDPIGVNAINSTNVSIKYPNGTYAYLGVIPTLESNGTFWKFYNYTFSNTTQPGGYTLEVSTQEDNGVIDTATTTKTVLSNVPAVSISPNKFGSSKDGVSKQYLHTVTNANGVDYDIIELNFTSTLSTVTLYQSDGVTALTDTDGDGLVDLGYVAPGASVNIVVNVFIPSGTPVDSNDFTNITAISSTDRNVSSLVTDQTTVLAGNPQMKQLYFHQTPLLVDQSNVTPPSNISLAKIVCLDGGKGGCPILNPSVSFPMQTNFSRDFKFTSDLKVDLWVVPEFWGVGGGIYPTPLGSCAGGTKDNIKVEVHTLTGQLVGSVSKSNIRGASADCIPQLETFYITPLITTIPAGNGLNITVYSTRKDTGLFFDSANFSSMVDMETSTYINTRTVNVYNSTNGLQDKYLYNTSYNLTFKANITDPFGAYDIKDVNITITAPNGSVLNSTNMTLESNSTSWKFFNFSREFLADNDIGTYTVLVSALESNGVVSNSSATFLFLSNGPEVKITPNNIGAAAANTTIEFLHTVTNAYVEQNDVADITFNYTSPQPISVAFTDIVGSPLTDTDSDGIIDTGTLTKAGGSKIIKAIVTLPANLNPSDVIVLNVNVNSSLNSSRSDFANDTINIVNNVPETKTLYLNTLVPGIGPGMMNTSPQKLATGNCINLDPQNVNGGGSGLCPNILLAPLSFNQTPNFFKDFDQDGNFLVKAYINSPAGADIYVELRTSSGTLIGSDFKSRLTTTGIQMVLFTINPSIGFIPKNESLILTFNELGRGDYDLYFDLASPSRLEMKTFTYISVDSLKTYNSTGSQKNLFAKGENVTLKINVSDPFTVNDIINLTLGLTYPNGTLYLNYTNLSNYANGSNWKAYNFTINSTNTLTKGIHLINAKAFELNGVIDLASSNFEIDSTPPSISLVSATPSFLTVNDTTRLRATITDNLKLSNATIYITHTNGTIYSYLMNNTFGNIFEYDYNLTDKKGTYYYYINATDSSDNIAISPTFSFKVVGPRALIGIENILPSSFKPGQDLNLKVPIQFESLDKEGSLIGLNVSSNKIDNSTSGKIYLETGGSIYNKFSYIGAKIQIENYDTNLSVNNGSNVADLEVTFYNGTGYSNPKVCDLNLEYGTVGNYAYNCSIFVVDKSIINAWASNDLNRKILVKAINLDNNVSSMDSINYSNVYITWDLPSNIRNYGYNPLDYNISLKVLDNTSGLMLDIATILNQNVFIVAGENVDLSSYWNPSNWNVLDGLNLGEHFVYGALINKYSGGVLVDDFGNVIEDFYSFTMDYLKINVISPNSSINQSPSKIWFNVSLDSISYPTGGWCGYSLDGALNKTMLQKNSTYYYDSIPTINFTEGVHNNIFYCNDTTNYISKMDFNFTYYDNKSPDINLISPLNNSLTNPLTLFNFNVSDDLNISSCSLFVDNILKNSSTNPTRNSQISLFAPGMVGGIHSWNVSCQDTSINNNLGYSKTWNFTIDDVVPQIGFVNITDLNNANVNRSWTYINVSINESFFNSSWLEWNNVVNDSLACSFTSGITWNCFLNKTGLPNNIYNYRACANDTSGNFNCTQFRNVSINASVPSIVIINPLNNSMQNASHNVSFEVLLTGNVFMVDSIWFEIQNDGIKHFLNSQSPSIWNSSLNLAVGKYNVSFYGNDTGGNNFSTMSNRFYVSSNKGINLSKEIFSLGSNSYLIKYNISNFGDKNNFVLFDLIDSNFTYYNFSLLNNGSSLINGSKYGNLLNWNFTLNPLSSLIITYNLNGSSDYNLLKNYMFGID